jgi:rsbT co-antagonist protein RsbR
MDRITTAFRAAMPAIIDELTDRLIAEQVEPYASIARAQLHGLSTAAVTAFEQDLAADTTEHFPAYWERIAGMRAEQGGDVAEILRAVTIGEQAMDSRMRVVFADEPELRAAWAYRMHHILHRGVVMLSQVFIVAHERMIQAQALQIRELSTPLIPLHAGILALPLVGTIDSYRATQIMESLLVGIAEQQADVVIIDITGVPVVDTGVGNHLLQAAQAAKLLGAQVILVGISTEVAQTMVQLGINLTQIVTLATLEAGITYAFGLQGLVVEKCASAMGASPALV